MEKYVLLSVETKLAATDVSRIIKVVRIKAKCRPSIEMPAVPLLPDAGYLPVLARYKAHV
jgi:hypothetical protein